MKDEEKYNIGDLQTIHIKAIIDSFFKENPKKAEEIFPTHFKGVNEDGTRYSYWKIGDVITGDGGKIMFDEAVRKAGEVYLDEFRKTHEK